jgi:plastocyanin
MIPVRLAAHAATLALVAPALALAACGDDEPVRLDEPVLRATLDEYRITPQEVSVAPGRLRIVARNTGRLAHDLEVIVPAEGPGEQPRELGGTPTAQPGETVEATLTLRAGEYELVCTLANHDDLGQYGTLIVEPG